ncbi:hypothetical protein [Papillibacter cinnamivorans]|uniref:Uncharacterized protein n=1 Tax=Papillibacter cinnamivorans DSM 12816 TaxID=1122930 RepID=A0A1W2AJP5_9FIRM|nr:hypothetical protein [Papillibacter cinnamivorans]SMC60742.1 hypothetical protein SAMN02745168_1759 [Papillibacter cinnamivorans DSM 12816]
MTLPLKLWLWLSVITAVLGAVLLFPIGTVPLNILFLVVKAGMITGLMLLIFKRRRIGFSLWSIFCAGAVLMTILKWNLSGQVSFLIIISIIVDIVMPAVAYSLMKKSTSEFR